MIFMIYGRAIFGIGDRGYTSLNASTISALLRCRIFWTMWSAVLANYNTVVSHIPSFDTIMPLPLERVQILADIPVLTGPPNVQKYGIPNGTFSHTIEDRRERF